MGQGVHRIDAGTGAVLESCTVSPLNNPRQLVLSPDAQTLWVVDSPGPNALFEIDNTVSLDTCAPAQVGGDLGAAWDLGLDPNGDLIVASTTEGLFQYLDPDTAIQTPIAESPDIASPHEIVALPEPDQLPMLVAGIATLWALQRRRRQLP